MFLYRKLSLMGQIILLIVMMLVALFLSFVITDSYAKKIVEQKVKESVNTVLLQVEEKMVSFDADMEGIFRFLFYSPTIQSYLGTEDELTRILMNNEVLSMFASATALKENIRGIQLYDKEGKILTSIGIGTENNVPAPVDTVQYSGLLEDSSPYYEDKRTYYTITTPIYQLDNKRLVTEFKGIGRFYLDVTNFSPILKSAQVTVNSQVLLIDDQHRIIAMEGGDSHQRSVFDLEEWEQRSNYIVQTIKLPRSNWELISLIPRQELLEDLHIIKQFNLITYAIMLMLLSLFLIIFLSRILNPIKKLMDFIKQYPKKGRESRFPVIYRNEIGVLASNLNKMLDDLEMLSSTVHAAQARMYEMELAKKQMEISAFRNQINPHFLYNTLESIRAVALFYNIQEIADISASLSNMFRYAVKGGNFSTIGDEISHVKEYAEIIHFRFRGRIKFRIDADEQLLQVTMLKMLLQPIVENAVYHGLERKVGEGCVDIKVRRSDEDRVQVVIRDDGRGMERSQFEEIVKRISHLQGSTTEEWGGKDEKGIGLLNICRRMKLFYGHEATMVIWSEEETGTRVKLEFPIRSQDMAKGVDDTCTES